MPRSKTPLLPPKAPVEFTPELKVRYLENLRATGFVTVSADLVGVTARCVNDHMNRDRVFLEECQHAKAYHTENVLVREAQRRAVEGVQEPIIGGQFKDEIVTHVTKYSDNLMALMLKARDASYSKGAGDGEGGGAGGGPTGGGGGVLIVMQAPHTMDEWERLFGEKAKGLTGSPK